MKKQIILRGLLGFPMGIAISTTISVIFSLLVGDKMTYYACPPNLVDAMGGNELYAVIVQYLLSGILGSSFSATSLIWEKDEWSIAKQTGIYFFINALVMFPVAYINRWMHHSFAGFVQYFMIFVIVFALIWFVQYLLCKKAVDGLNAKIREK